MSFHPDARSQPAALPKNQILQINGILITEETGQQGNKNDADQRDTAASHQLLHALGLSLCVIKKQ